MKNKKGGRGWPARSAKNAEDIGRRRTRQRNSKEGTLLRGKKKIAQRTDEENCNGWSRTPQLHGSTQNWRETNAQGLLQLISDLQGVDGETKEVEWESTRFPGPFLPVIPPLLPLLLPIQPRVHWVALVHSHSTLLQPRLQVHWRNKHTQAPKPHSIALFFSSLSFSIFFSHSQAKRDNTGGVVGGEDGGIGGGDAVEDVLPGNGPR